MRLILTILLNLFILLCFPKEATCAEFNSTKNSEINGATLTEFVTITYPDQYDHKYYKSLVAKLGYIFQPHSSITHKKLIKDQIIFNVKYTIGDYGLRSIPPQFLNINSNEHLIIAGDSNVFGEGCVDGDSITAQLSKALPSFHAYNFGQRGGGPHNTLSLMEHYPYQNLIQEKKGVFLYNFFTGHMYERVIGGKNYIAWDKGMSPYYALDDKLEAIYLGSFNDRFITKIYKFINLFPFLNNLLPTLPQINSKHVQLISKIFLKMKNIYLQHFPQGKFIVIINDSYVFTKDPNALNLKESLKKEGIEQMDIPYNGGRKEQFIFKDMHINPLGQKMQSEIISQKLLKILSLN